jgi:GH25 family lysozyme M1 (1,4-beta-N-acetylmuramidase)
VPFGLLIVSDLPPMVDVQHNPHPPEEPVDLVSPSRPVRPRRPARPPRALSGHASIVAGLALLLVLGMAPTASASPVSPASAPTGPMGPTADAGVAMLEGIDVSHWQGTINWTKVAAAGKKFAIIKATDGQVQADGKLYIDPMYATNHAEAKAAGLWTGAYHFARPSTNAGDAVAEADHFASVMKLGAGDLIPALDLEDNGGMSIAALQTWVTRFVDEVYAKIGMRPMIYTSPSFWKNKMGDTRKLADAGYKTLWIAHWGVAAPTVPAQNWGGHGWTFWQYTSDGSVSGITGRVDLDRFNGLDLTPQAYSVFKLAAALPGGAVKQGTSSAATVTIKRINFPSDVALEVSGLPAGTTGTFNENPSADAGSVLTVKTPADPTATPIGTYPLTITGTSSGITRTTILNLVIADGIPPTVTAPTTGLYTGKTLGSTTVPVRVRWSATDPSGIAREALQRSIAGGTWTNVSLSTATTTTSNQLLTVGKFTRQRSRATDRIANTSNWSQGPSVRATITQQTSTGVTWSGSWHTVKTTKASGGSLRYSTAAGASATFRFSGSSVAWVAARGTSRGSARVYVDGVYAGLFSLRASTSAYRSIVFARNWSAVGTHTLKIVVVGNAGHPRVDVDALARLAFQ